MTDKEKRELKKGVISIFNKFNILDHTITIGGLRDDILRYIDSLQEEPISEDKDLEETIKNIKLLTSNTALLTFEHGFRKGANWQKKQDQETIELAEDHAMLAGMNKMEQQMMKNAIDAHCFGFQGDALFSFRLPANSYLVGSKVKVIVIKNE